MLLLLLLFFCYFENIYINKFILFLDEMATSHCVCVWVFFFSYLCSEFHIRFYSISMSKEWSRAICHLNLHFPFHHLSTIFFLDLLFSFSIFHVEHKSEKKNWLHRLAIRTVCIQYIKSYFYTWRVVGIFHTIVDIIIINYIVIRGEFAFDNRKGIFDLKTIATENIPSTRLKKRSFK